MRDGRDRPSAWCDLSELRDGMLGQRQATGGGAPGSNTTSTHTGPIIADQGLGMEARLYDFGNPVSNRRHL